MRRINFRELAEVINAEDLIDPEFQSDHPTVKGVADIAFFNALPEYGREIVNTILSSGQSIPLREAYKVTRDSDPNVDDLEEMLFAGLMTDADYEDYIEMKEQKPKISARDYYTKLCAHNEKDAAVKKLARIFEAILDAPETNEEYVPHISRAEFEKMKHDIEWVKKNLKGLEKSRKVWS